MSQALTAAPFRLPIDDDAASMALDALEGGAVLAVALETLPFTDLYIRLDARDASWFKVGANNQRQTGLRPVPEEFSHAVDFLRGLVAKGDSDEGTVTLDSMRLRFCRAPVSDNGKWASLRRIPLDLPYLEGLFLKPEAVKDIRDWGARRGIVLVGGATGAGKTTTAVAAINTYLQTRSEVAIAIEDPPEYMLKGQVGKGVCFQFLVDDERDWSAKVKLALRWRPRYILIGEIRTPDAAAQALRASTSGHLVLATVHGGSVEETLGAVIRLAEASLGKAASTLLADNLVGVVHQRLNSYGPDVTICKTSTGSKGTDQVRKIVKEGNLLALKEHQVQHLADRTDT